MVSVTTGARSHDWELSDEQKEAGTELDIEKRQKEARDKKLGEIRKACAILGITDVRALDYPDDMELLNEEMIQEIGNLIREVRPDIMITHHPYEDGGFKLHATVGRAAMFAMRKAQGSGRGKSLPGHMVPSIYFMNPTAYVGSGLDNSFIGKIDLYVDITDVIERKVKSVGLYHQSSIMVAVFARKRAESCDGHFGHKARVSYAEPFQRYFPWVSYTLPVSDFELERYENSERMLERQSTIIPAHMPLPEGHDKIHTIVEKELYNY